MMSHRKSRRSILLTALGGMTAATIALTGCGVSSAETPAPSSTATADPKIFESLPESYKQSKELAVAIGAEYPPLEFTDAAGKFTGLEHDLAVEMAKRMGLEAKFSHVDFAATIIAIQAKKYDIGAYGFLDTKKRQEVVTVVDTINTSSSIAMREEDVSKVKTVDDLCGMRVGVGNGTAQQKDAQEASEKCVAAGKKALDIQVLEDVWIALTSKRIDAVLNGTPALTYRVKRTPGLAIAGEPYRYVPYGFIVNKDNTQLSNAMRDAIKQMMDDGTYKQILAKYDLPTSARDEATINAGQ